MLRPGKKLAGLFICSGDYYANDPTRPRYKLADLMAEMPEGLPRVEGWDETPSVGLQNC